MGVLMLILLIVVVLKGHPFRKFLIFVGFSWFLCAFMYVWLFFLERNFVDDLGYANPPSWEKKKDFFDGGEGMGINEEEL